MWALDTDREGVLRILQAEESEGEARPISEMSEARVREGRVRLLWGEARELRELPVGIMVPHQEMEEFFAWTNTYLPSWSPITAFFRVVSHASELGTGVEQVQPMGVLYQPAALALTIGEAVVQSGARYDVERLPYSGCIATFSFVAARGMRRGIAVEDLAMRWDVCRRATGQDSLTVRIGDLVGPWQVLEDVSRRMGGKDLTVSSKGSRRALGDALSDIVKYGEVGDRAWRAVTRGFPEVRDTLVHMTDTQEARILAFERMLKEAVSGRRTRSLEASFSIGYVASLIAPGSLKHASMLMTYLDRFPTAVMWLALFASVYKKSHLRMTKLAHLVWKAISEDEDLLGRPKCDIALAEFGILKDAGYVGENLQGSTRGRLVVELAPGISTTVRWPRQEETVDNPGQGELFARDGKELMSIANELEELRWHLEKLTKRLEQLRAKRS